MLTRFALLAMSLSIALTLPSAEAHAREVTAEETQNPLTRLRGLSFQNNFDFGPEEDSIGCQLVLQPWQTSSRGADRESVPFAILLATGILQPAAPSHFA